MTDTGLPDEYEFNEDCTLDGVETEDRPPTDENVSRTMNCPWTETAGGEAAFSGTDWTV